MRVRIIAVGRGMPAPVKAMVTDYGKRLSRYLSLELQEVAEEKGANTSAARRRGMGKGAVLWAPFPLS